MYHGRAYEGIVGVHEAVVQASPAAQGVRRRAAEGLRDSDELAPPVDLSTAPAQVSQVPVDLVDPSEDNPRIRLEGIQELTESIRAHGLLQPIVVRRKGERFTLVAGHRRFAAIRELGWESVLAVIREETAEDAYVLTLVENLQRDDLTPREESEALGELVRRRGWSTREVAAAIKRSQAYVSKRLRVFDEPVLRPAVLSRRLPVSSAEELLTLDEATRHALLEQALREGWGQTQLRAAVRRRRFVTNRRRPRGGRAPALRRLAEELRRQLRAVDATGLDEADRRALRRLFLDLALVARAGATRGRRRPVIPPVPG